MQNPLNAYRRTQRDLRREFESFTKANCPSCPTPCCRQPARIAPTDILLAEAAGWKSTLPAGVPDAAAVAARMAAALHSAPASAEAEPDEPDESLPCEFLGAGGCTFPSDLRPYGCTTYICRYMYAQLDRPALTRLKRLVRDLDNHHGILLRTLRKPGALEK